MAHNGGRITAPVDTEDVRLTIGEPSDNVKTLCMSGRINPWAKYKPEAHGTMRSLTKENRKLWNFGLFAAQIYTSVTSFINAVADGTFNGGWTYRNVRAGDWGRLDDFDGYNHYARSPIGSLEPQTLEAGSGGDLVVPAVPPPGIAGEGDGVIDTADANGEISFSEFQGSDGHDYGNWYFGILLYRSESDRMIATSSVRMSDQQEWQVNFGPAGGSGVYQGIPFISSKKITPGVAFPSDVRIAGCNSDGVNIRLVAAKDMYFHSGNCVYPDAAVNTIDYRLTIRNNSTQPYTTDVVLLVASDSNGSYSQSVAQFPGITIPAGQSWTKEGSANIAYSGVASAFFKWFRFGSSGWIDISVGGPTVPDKPTPWEPE